MAEYKATAQLGVTVDGSVVVSSSPSPVPTWVDGKPDRNKQAVTSAGVPLWTMEVLLPVMEFGREKLAPFSVSFASSEDEMPSLSVGEGVVLLGATARVQRLQIEGFEVVE